jgi:hypothetical protein
MDLRGYKARRQAMTLQEAIDTTQAPITENRYTLSVRRQPSDGNVAERIIRSNDLSVLEKLAEYLYSFGNNSTKITDTLTGEILSELEY